MDEIHLEEALKIYKNQELILEQQNEEYEKCLSKYNETIKDYQSINEENFNKESKLSNEKWRSFESAKIALTNRDKFELNRNGLVRKSDEFLKADKTKKLKNIINIGENTFNNIKELDSDLDTKILQHQIEEFEKKTTLSIDQLRSTKEQYNNLLNFKGKPTGYELFF
ncbi:hypothetical protein GWI33_021831 [Rhynchophorus ferrugineus]|uniref:Uncharacterized protein n=1 Tax=Rhynchophorus ferrugineus TaxID=354439 RepID=A0A834ITA7_RHYFE|nr:hypothetical protein GWI33_021831 [Rhynchophorus ferrugineus]